RVHPAAASAAVATAPSPPAPAAKHRDMPDEHWDKWGAARDGARIVLTRPQWFTLAMVILVGQVFLILRPHLVLMIWIDIVTALYLATGAYKIWLLVRGEMATSRFVAPPPAKTEDLPTYTILVPLHREGRILPVLVERLKMLDYPVDRLQILLLIERDDEETKSAVAEYALPKHIRSMTMPEGQPRTKPRALNI